MDKEFVPYDVAEALRGLGMTGPTLAVWMENGHFPVLYLKQHASLGNYFIPAPTYRQAFAFMRSRFALYPNIEPVQGVPPAGCAAWIKSPIRLDSLAGVYNSYEEAELACLKQMIGSVQPIRKLNGGDGSDLCPVCRRILPEGNRGYSESIDQQPVQ
jgi:hypothetical protein